MSTKNKPKGLGRGLGAILDIKDFDGDKNKPVFRGGVEEIRLASIKPNPTQPRQDFDEESLSELAGSIRTLGLIQPLTVRKESYESYTRWPWWRTYSVRISTRWRSHSLSSV